MPEREGRPDISAKKNIPKKNDENKEKSWIKVSSIQLGDAFFLLDFNERIGKLILLWDRQIDVGWHMNPAIYIVCVNRILSAFECFSKFSF